MLPDTMNSYTTKNILKVVDRVHTIYILRLLYYKVLASIGTSINSMRAAAAILVTGSAYSIIRCSVALRSRKFSSFLSSSFLSAKCYL